MKEIEIAMEEKEVVLVLDEQSLRDKIYVIRGRQVMLDFDLAEIYGYETKNFNRQVKNNAAKFEGEEFMFRLTREEAEELSRCNNFTSIQTKGVKGGRAYLPHAFTEQGVYMLMTVLRGDLAVRQSRSLVMAFKAMKDYIIENQQLLITQRDYIALATKVNENSGEIKEIKRRMDNLVTQTDLSDFMKLFDQGKVHEEILILNGEPFKADLAYQTIYSKTKNNLIIIDDYISTKTLQHLLYSKNKVKLTIISDNKARPKLRKSEYDDFLNENPGRDIEFVTTAGKAHDRYIILDYGTKDMRVYHCGASSKDAGKKITTIAQVKDVSGYGEMVKDLLVNANLVLK